jgi:hypothetical protein
MFVQTVWTIFGKGECEMRGINDEFIKDLQSDCLGFFLNQARENEDIILEIRDGYLNLYYRGGSALKITQKKRGGYSFKFDLNYCQNKADTSGLQKVASLKTAREYKDSFFFLLKEMDSWFAEHPKQEREIQHDLIKFNTADFCILDIEYKAFVVKKKGELSFSLDMIAVHDGRIILVENKNGGGAITGKAGLSKHYNDMCSVIKNLDLREELIQSMRNIAENKKKLGLPYADIAAEPHIEILFLIFNANKIPTESRKIDSEIQKIHEDYTYPVKLIKLCEKAEKIKYEEAEPL